MRVTAQRPREFATRTTSAKAYIQRMPVVQLIAVAATYNFVRLPRAGARSNDRGPHFAPKACECLSAFIGHDEISTQRGLSSVQAAAEIAMRAV